MTLDRSRLASWSGALLLGAVLGLLGTFTHRSAAPWGLVVAFATVLAAGVLARSFAGTGGVLALGTGWLVAVQLLALRGPGGDVLVPADAVGYWWVYGGVVFVVAAAFAPRSWFDDAVREDVMDEDVGPSDGYVG